MLGLESWIELTRLSCCSCLTCSSWLSCSGRLCWLSNFRSDSPLLSSVETNSSDPALLSWQTPIWRIRLESKKNQSFRKQYWGGFYNTKGSYRCLGSESSSARAFASVWKCSGTKQTPSFLVRCLNIAQKAKMRALGRTTHWPRKTQPSSVPNWLRKPVRDQKCFCYVPLNGIFLISLDIFFERLPNILYILQNIPYFAF